MKIVTVEEMQSLEEQSLRNGGSVDDLIDMAGFAVAQKAKDFMGDIRGVPILVLVGSGNNGSDGLVAARYLADWGSQVTIYLTSARKKPDHNIRLLQDLNVSILDADEDVDLSELDECLSQTTLVIDAILGTGKSRAIQATLSSVMSKLIGARSVKPTLKLLAVDMPSGLDANSGEVDEVCPAADITVALGFPKVGMFAFPGASRVGRLEVAGIGLSPELSQSVKQELITPDFVRQTLPDRPMDAHKGSFGKVFVIAGSDKYVGAASLACQAAARVGAGLVTLAVSKRLQSLLAEKLTETTYVLLPEDNMVFSDDAVDIISYGLVGSQSLLIGCGLGQKPDVSQLIRRVLLGYQMNEIPLVLDADALNILSSVTQWWLRIKGPAVLTPHPGEMARLVNLTPTAINADRVNIVRYWANKWNKVIVLKGAYTVIGDPSGLVRVSPFANAALASAGTGDVLAGIIAGFLAQGLSTFDAATCAVYTHGAAGHIASQEIGKVGVVASDLLPRLPQVIKHLEPD